jgi:hypothetical protein
MIVLVYKETVSPLRDSIIVGTMWIAQFGLVQLGSYNTCNSSTFLASKTSRYTHNEFTLPLIAIKPQTLWYQQL